ncbi:MAG: hypothetical protein IPK74_28985 [Deltaproteobacteria bacterium]|nr:hypothetical protein [Deltaproteobacteria bacterium]
MNKSFLTVLALATAASTAPVTAFAATKAARAASGKGSVTVPSQPVASRYFGLNHLWLAFTNEDPAEVDRCVAGCNHHHCEPGRQRRATIPSSTAQANYVLPAGTTIYETVKTDCRPGAARSRSPTAGRTRSRAGRLLVEREGRLNVWVVAIEAAVGTGYV